MRRCRPDAYFHEPDLWLDRLPEDVQLYLNETYGVVKQQSRRRGRGIWACVGSIDLQQPWLKNLSDIVEHKYNGIVELQYRGRAIHAYTMQLFMHCLNIHERLQLLFEDPTDGSIEFRWYLGPDSSIRLARVTFVFGLDIRGESSFQPLYFQFGHDTPAFRFF